MINKRYLSIMRLGAIALFTAALTACGGGGGGTSEVNPTPTPTPVDPALVAQAKAETCALCHTDTGNGSPVAKSGPLHMADYEKYTDASKFTLTIDSVSTVAGTSSLTFTATKSGVPMTAAQLAGIAQHTFYAVPYDNATRTFGTSFSYSAGTTAANYVPTGTPGQFTVTKTSAPFAPEATNSEVYAYIADGVLDTEGMTLYDDVANAGKAFGNVTSYQSAANVSACESCHGKPYMKHGYRMAKVAGLSDFGACKNCHYDSRDGHDINWQINKDNPDRYAEIVNGSPNTPEETAKYAYKAKIMNDVHMSHNMEFPYPQSMQSCVTCHAGHLGDTASNDIFADSKFVASTCVSCHSVDGLKTKMTKKTSTGAAITIHDSFIAKIDDPAQRDTVTCTVCHGKAAGIGPTFASIHKNGYDPLIYATDGTRYSDTFVVTIDSATIDAATNMLDVKFHATGTLGSISATKIKPTVMVGLYGYDTKDFIVGAHLSAADGKRNLEHVWGDGNPRFTDVSASNGSWEVKVDLTLWKDKIAANVVRRAEIAVLPEIRDASNRVLGLNAPSKTFNIAANAFEDYFPNLVNVFKTANANTNGSIDGCNTCHDQLATTFHSGIRGGNIKVCRICHEVSSAGSHLELQSRSIDSYIHGIHSFQAFDPGDVNYDDPAAVVEYEEHIAHHFPRFTIKDCEACHVNSTAIYTAGRHAYDVPDQHHSMPGVLSGSDVIAGREVGDIPPSVTGPAVRACGACHRAQALNTDDAGRLATQRSHWQSFGTYIETTSDMLRALWEAVVAKIMPLFS
jgi:OmcA/MtrC family decaheme c-type cytochrome